jgi:hypothetical protein
VQLEGLPAAQPLVLRDALGRVVMRMQVPDGRFVLPSSLAPGRYTVQVEGGATTLPLLIAQ